MVPLSDMSAFCFVILFAGHVHVPPINMHNVSMFALSAFAGEEENLLMYRQEPPRGDGAAGSVHFHFSHFFS